MNNLTDKVKKETKHSKEKSDEHGEVFTPVELINQMCDSLPKDFWYDKNKTWFDPCAGKGNMPAVLVERLMETLSIEIGDVSKRYAHIMENMIYMCEFQRESAEMIKEIFNPNDNLKLNLYCGDTLTMPVDFFDISYEERFVKYPDNCIQPKEKLKVKQIDPWMENIMKLARTILNKTEIKSQTIKTDINKYIEIAKKINDKKKTTENR